MTQPQPQPMPSVRRRMPGMSNQSQADHPAAAVEASPPPSTPRRRTPAKDTLAVDRRRAEHRRSRDYATTRLVNFRIPVDVHDRFKQLMHEVEQGHPRLRHPSLTELLIGLLEEGPQTADEIAGVIRRKRAAEHAEEP